MTSQQLFNDISILGSNKVGSLSCYRYDSNALKQHDTDFKILQGTQRVLHDLRNNAVIQSAHLANIDSQIARALVQANDHVTIDLIFCRYHHDATALSPSDAKWGSDPIFMGNQGSLVSGFDFTFKHGKSWIVGIFANPADLSGQWQKGDGPSRHLPRLLKVTEEGGSFCRRHWIS